MSAQAPGRMVNPDTPIPPDMRHVTIRQSDISGLSLLELAEVSELSGLELSTMVADLTAGHAATAIRALVAIAVVLGRRHEPTLTMADARRWAVDLIGDGPAVPPRARAPRRGPGPRG